MITESPPEPYPDPAKIREGLNAWKYAAFEHTMRSIRSVLQSGSAGVRDKNKRLENHIRSASSIQDEGFDVAANVEALKFGAAWEVGFTRPAYDIFPSERKALAFQPSSSSGGTGFVGRFRATIRRWMGKAGGAASTGGIILRKRVRMPAKTFARKSFVESTMQDLARSGYYLNSLRIALEAATKRAWPNANLTVWITKR